MDYNWSIEFTREFGIKIRFYRNKHHFTIEKLADLADMSATYLGEIERGENIISLEYAIRLLTVLQVDLNEFFMDLRPPYVKENNRDIRIRRDKIQPSPENTDKTK